ncbi:hypothetical protein C7447_102543 [Tenacibaculum adriaticum]|uniref:DUF2971 family protein n=1 Tax=Tenacibaculum adriaticum TaxID=413713 RepID=A0A5S5DTK5_9FLAO|nr:hypothetical protein [Tenacibaculum adriaticum]TYP99221.1 hypothetical protein C7447_102543 [Tenacibaculum adriaticum]
MIVKNDNLDIPHGNTVIWRYVGLDKFLDLLMSQELFFSNAAKMSDKYEGLIPKRNQDYLLKSIKNGGLSREEAELERQARLREIHSLKELTLLNCWTINQNESYALWKIYLGGAKSGVAIRTTVSKLTRAIKKGNDPFKEDIFLSKVKYTDFIKDEPENRFNVITTKNKFYDYEKELRLFIFHHPLSEGGIPTPYDISVGRRLKVDLNELIDEIYLSPFVGKWFDKSFIEILNKIHPSLSEKIKNSEILDE